MDFSININDITGQARPIAERVDDGDKKLQNKEISIFTKECKESNIDLANEDWAEKYKNILELHSIEAPKLEDVVPADATRVHNNYEILPEKIKSMIDKEIELRNENKPNSFAQLSDEDKEYWADIIDNVSKEYDVPASMIVSIVAQESHFKKNVHSKNGAGAMGITTISIKDFFPGQTGSWNKIYEKMDSNLLNDILYKKDSDGNFVTDKDGNKVLKYKTPKEMREACQNDDELAIKIGLLSFEMDYVKSVAAMKKGRATYANVPSIINGLQDDSIKLDSKEQQKCVKNALNRYNSVYESYGGQVMDSLKVHNLNFEQLNLI